MLATIDTDSEFPAALTGAGDKLAILYFTASWCGPCRTIAPVVSDLANQYADTTSILKIDLDTCKIVARQFQVTSVPTFIFIKKGATLDKFSGADPNRLKDAVQKHQTTAIPSASDENAIPGAPGHSDLVEFVAKNTIECLNQSRHHTITGLLDDNELFLESDADEQLIISVSFNQPVKIHSLNFVAPLDGRGPKKVRIFANSTSVPDFSDCEEMNCTQELTLSNNDFKRKSLSNLFYVKFQNINNIVIFVESNQNDRETTVLNYLQFIGSPCAGTNMKDFKRVSGESGERHG